jgi:ABC-2 type transport system permease protein
MLNRIKVVAGRVLNQLRRDHRFVGISIIFPLIIIYFIKVVFDVLASPMC